MKFLNKRSLILPSRSWTLTGEFPLDCSLFPSEAFPTSPWFVPPCQESPAVCPSFSLHARGYRRRLYKANTSFWTNSLILFSFFICLETIAVAFVLQIKVVYFYDVMAFFERSLAVSAIWRPMTLRCVARFVNMNVCSPYNNNSNCCYEKLFF